jgi:putative oxidoreductase
MNTPTILQASRSTETTENPIRALLQTLVRTGSSATPAVLRLTLAAVMFPHGAQKMLGWFGGYGFTGTMGFFTGTMGIPWLLAFGTIMIEFFAPILLLIGAGTRLAALGLGVVMTTAMLMVHAQNGFFMNWSGTQKGEGIEYFLLFIGMTIALIISGGGRWSVDRTIHTD